MFPDTSVALLAAAAMVLILLLVRARIPVGVSILAGGLLIWLVRSADTGLLIESAKRAALAPKNWDLLAALFAVMAIEGELQGARAVDAMVRALQGLFRSTRLTLAVMPAFVGLLPSAGGARFSAPIVNTATRGLSVSAEEKGAINFWFRHVFENVRPISPGLILACAIARVDVTDTILHLIWLPVIFTAAGWLVMLRPVATKDSEAPREALSRTVLLEACLAVLPIAASFALMLGSHLGAGLSIGLVAAAMIPVLRLAGKPVSLKAVLKEACDAKLFLSVAAILYFIELVSGTGVLNEIARKILEAPLPLPVLLFAIGFVPGLVLGMTPGYVGVAMPIAAALFPEGSVWAAGYVLTGGMLGIMLTPTHLCLTVTLAYFKADLMKTLWPCAKAAALFLALFALFAWLLW